MEVGGLALEALLKGSIDSIGSLGVGERRGNGVKNQNPDRAWFVGAGRRAEEVTKRGSPARHGQIHIKKRCRLPHVCRFGSTSSVFWTPRRSSWQPWRRVRLRALDVINC